MQLIIVSEAAAHPSRSQCVLVTSRVKIPALYESPAYLLNFPASHFLSYLFTSLLIYFFKIRPVLFSGPEIVRGDQTFL